MTPQLQQAIKLLQLPCLELQGYIRELLESNVMLESEEDGGNTTGFEAMATGLNDRELAPGARTSAAVPQHVVPDVFVRGNANGWIVEMNPATPPRVRINESQASLIAGGAGHAVMQAQLQDARWLLKFLEIRHDTLLKVARSIVERQHEFLDLGEAHMRPVILDDIAAATGMHQSTVWRVTSGKYMHTPRGVFALRYFFSSQAV
jgi:RNA polymerase sigma-54 factor